MTFIAKDKAVIVVLEQEGDWLLILEAGRGGNGTRYIKPTIYAIDSEDSTFAGCANFQPWVKRGMITSLGRYGVRPALRQSLLDDAVVNYVNDRVYAVEILELSDSVRLRKWPKNLVREQSHLGMLAKAKSLGTAYPDHFQDIGEGDAMLWLLQKHPINVGLARQTLYRLAHKYDLDVLTQSERELLAEQQMTGRDRLKDAREQLQRLREHKADDGYEYEMSDPGKGGLF